MQSVNHQKKTWIRCAMSQRASPVSSQAVQRTFRSARAGSRDLLEVYVAPDRGLDFFLDLHKYKILCQRASIAPRPLRVPPNASFGYGRVSTLNILFHASSETASGIPTCPQPLAGATQRSQPASLESVRHPNTPSASSWGCALTIHAVGGKHMHR